MGREGAVCSCQNPISLRTPLGPPAQEAKVITTQDAQGHSLSEAKPRAQAPPHPGDPEPSWRGGAPACKTLRSPLPSACLWWCLLSSLLLPFLIVHVGRVVAMTPRAGGRLWRLFWPNPHARSPGGRGAMAAPPPLVQLRGETGRGPHHTPQNLEEVLALGNEATQVQVWTSQRF